MGNQGSSPKSLNTQIKAYTPVPGDPIISTEPTTLMNFLGKLITNHQVPPQSIEDEPYVVYRPKSIVKVLIFGDKKTGKSSLVNRFVHNTFTVKYFRTVGVNFCTKEVYLNHLVTLQIWDISECCKKTGVAFYLGADCVVLVFDITNRDSFEHLGFWKNDFLTTSETIDLENFPFLVVGNKSDLGGEERQVTTEEAQMWCYSQLPNAVYFETSAQDGTNTEETFLKVASFT